MAKIFLAIDVGNSNIHIGLFNSSWTIPKLQNLKHILNDIDVNLTLKGLAIIYQRIIKGRNK